MNSLYLLDTNILVHYVRRDPVWEWIRERRELLTRDPRPLISIVTVGEARSLALQFRWGLSKIKKLNFALSYFEELPVARNELVDIYATLDSVTTLAGRPMGKNDLWIASTAIACQATLLTTDRDFLAIDPRILHVDWIDSTSILT